jgi:hypothetical protein
MSSVDRELDHLYPGFGARYGRVLDAVNAWCAVHAPRFRAVLGEGLRSRARQQSLYAQGRTVGGPIVTKLDGVRSISGHQTGLAADTWFERDGTVVWEGVPWNLYAWYGHCCRAEGLVWGGDWDGDQRSSDERFVDAPHCEWPRSDKATYRAARRWKSARGLQ